MHLKCLLEKKSQIHVFKDVCIRRNYIFKCLRNEGGIVFAPCTESGNWHFIGGEKGCGWELARPSQEVIYKLQPTQCVSGMFCLINPD